MAEWLGSMRHLEPRQLEDKKDPAKARRKASLMPLAAIAIAIALAGGYGLTHRFAAAPADHVTQQEQQQRTQAFRNMAPLKLDVIPVPRIKDAVTAMNLPAPDDEALRKDLKVAAPVGAPVAVSAAPAATNAAAQSPESLRLIELVLWDTDAPDGDSVRISSGGFTREVILSKTPTLVYLPYSGSGTIQVTGLHDGGGGITLGLKSSSTSVLMPVLSEGQVLALPVSLP